MTPQRHCVFRLLTAGGPDAHPTAEAIYVWAREEMPTISLKTVYETLRALVSLGELHQLNVGMGPAHFDSADVDHGHQVCHRCGMIRNIDITIDIDIDISIDTSTDGTEAEAEAGGIIDVGSGEKKWLAHADDHGFMPESTNVIVYGLCARCRLASSGCSHAGDEDR